MKFLLTAVNAKYIHSNPALYSLRAYVGERREHVKILEMTINHEPEQVLAAIYREQPDVIGISCYIWNISFVKQLVRDLRVVLPDTPIWLGGPEVSYRAKETLAELPEVTGIMCGEGEMVFSQLLDAYLAERKECVSAGEGTVSVMAESAVSVDGIGSGTEDIDISTRLYSRFKEIHGLAFRDKAGEFRFTGCAEPLDLSTIPFLYEETEPFENRIIYYESSRGCPFRCSYCLSSIDKRVRFRDLSLVLAELQYFLDRKVRQVKFVDRTFNCKVSHSLAIWKYLAEHDNGVTNFHFEISADLITDEELAVLRTMRPGLIQLEIGVQSTNEETLAAIHRGSRTEDIRRVSAAIGSFGNIHQHLDLIAGLPYEDLISFMRSFDEVYAMQPDQLQLGFLKVLAGSEMYDRAAEYGIRYRDYAPYEVLETRWLSFGDILLLKQVEEMTEVYYNSGLYPTTVRACVREEGSPFAFYRALAGFYEKHGLSAVKHARSARYEILRDFVRERYPDRAREIEALLVYDYYLRENAKSPLSFEEIYRPENERMNDFYRREASERRYLPDYEGMNGRQLLHMTHISVFPFDPVRFSETGEITEEASVCLYDYRRRDPLSGNAAVIRVDEEYDRIAPQSCRA